MAGTILYSLDTNNSDKEWAKRIISKTKAISGGDTTLEQIYLDSFDWLFHNKGIKLLVEKRSSVDHIILRWFSNEPALRRPAATVLEKIPKHVSDFPPGKMCDHISNILGIRALIPQVSIRVKQVPLLVSDKEGKTRVRLYIEKYQTRPNGRGRFIDLGLYLRIETLIGYEKDFRDTLKRLDKLEGLNKTRDDLFDKALEVTERHAGDYSSKVSNQLERDWRVDRACREVLLGQLDQIERNVEGTIANIDTEFLHDLRVAVRRSRSLLNRMKGAFPKGMLERFSTELAWLGSITTPLRDLDVYMLDYPKFQNSLRLGVRKDLEPFYEFLSAHHKAEQLQLTRQLQSKRFNNFCKRWRNVLEKPLPKRSTASLALQAIGDVADARIWKTYRRLIQEGSAINSDSPDEAIHNLRKTCKKLRYLLEFFSSLYPQKKIKGIIKSLKVFQENLGDFQDLSVQAEKLKGFEQDMINEGKDNAKTLKAMDSLIKNMHKNKKKVRAVFSERFASFASKDVENQFRELCGRDKKK